MCRNREQIEPLTPAVRARERPRAARARSRARSPREPVGLPGSGALRLGQRRRPRAGSSRRRRRPSRRRARVGQISPSAPPSAVPSTSPDARGRADHSHALRARAVVGEIGHRGLRGADARAEEAAEEARDQHLRERVRERQQQERGGRTEQRHEQHGRPPDAIGDPAPQRQEQHQAQRVQRGDEPDAERVDAELAARSEARRE